MKKTVYLPILIMIIVGAATFGAIKLSSMNAVKTAFAEATVIKPEPLTELYFENHSSLPKIITLGQTGSVSFTIHNLEFKDVTYPYEFYIVSDDRKILISAKEILVKDGEYKTIVEEFGPLAAKRMKLVVELKNKIKQDISFWVEPQK